jgi:hypothetical protein
MVEEGRNCAPNPQGILRCLGSPFDEPIRPPKGKKLVMLRDAALYITKLPKAEHEAAEWQAAPEALILVATQGGPRH